MNADAVAQVKQLARWLEGTDIELLELSRPDSLIRLRQAPRTAPAPAQVASPPAAMEPQPTATLVRAGSVGIVLHRHPARDAALVRAGDSVVAGQALALLKIGTALLAVPAPRAGIVTRIVAAHGSVVGWGDPLVEIE